MPDRQCAVAVRLRDGVPSPSRSMIAPLQPVTRICIDCVSAAPFSPGMRYRAPIWPRAIVSALVAIAIAVVPIDVAWAGSAAHHGVVVTGAQHHPEAASEPVVGAMHDCASKMKGATKSHLPCCAKDLACPPEFCIAKCFQLVSFLELSSAPLPVGTSRLTAFDHARPPDWSVRPQPPPPRT